MTEAEVLLGTLITDAGAMLAAARVPEPRREALRLWAELVEGSPVDAMALARSFSENSPAHGRDSRSAKGASTRTRGPAAGRSRRTP